MGIGRQRGKERPAGIENGRTREKERKTETEREKEKERRQRAALNLTSSTSLEYPEDLLKYDT